MKKNNQFVEFLKNKKLLKYSITIAFLLAFSVFYYFATTGVVKFEEPQGVGESEKIEDVLEETDVEGTPKENMTPEEKMEASVKQGEEKYAGETAFVFDRDKYYMNGIKEPAEEKKKNYSELLTSEFVPFQPKIVDEIGEYDMAIEQIEGIGSKGMEEVVEELKKAGKEYEKTLNAEQMEDLKKINQVMEQVNEAYKNFDYHQLAKQYYKEFRESIGLVKIRLLANYDYMEVRGEFIPDKIDERLGLAIGYSSVYSIRLTELKNIEKKEDITEEYLSSNFKSNVALIMMKENDKGEWEIYYEMFE